MKDIIKHIDCDGQIYPLVFNLNVLEEIQEKYGSIEKWADLVDGGDEKVPSIKDLKFGIRAMINEGIDMENEANGSNRALLTEKQVGRLLTSYGTGKILLDTQDLTIESTKVDEEPKNM